MRTFHLGQTHGEFDSAYPNKAAGRSLWRILAPSLVCLATCTAPASAGLTFNFSFDNVSGNTPGPIEGVIFGLMDSPGFQSATEVRITSVGGHADSFSEALPFDVLANGWIARDNNFEVENGQITSWGALFENSADEEAVTELLDLGSRFPSFPVFDLPARFETNRGTATERTTISPPTSVTFTAVAAVPEPSSLVLVGLASAALAAGRLRTKRRGHSPSPA